MTERTMSNECYSCTHRQNVPGDCHISCANPDPEMTADRHGVMNGWFWYPINFDPIWKTSMCNNYKEIK